MSPLSTFKKEFDLEEDFIPFSLIHDDPHLEVYNGINDGRLNAPHGQHIWIFNVFRASLDPKVTDVYLP